MPEIDLTADELVSSLLALSSSEPVCILDSCGVGHHDSHLLIAGISPVATFELSGHEPAEQLALLDEKLASGSPAILTLSYDLGANLLGIKSSIETNEPDIFLAQFDVIIVHDYHTGKTRVEGDPDGCACIQRVLQEETLNFKFEISNKTSRIASNFSQTEYLDTVEEIKERIRRGDTYQTNLTQQLTAALPADLTPQQVFAHLRRDHPAPFAAFIQRKNSTVVSTSPERFFRVDLEQRMIETSPIKGTRPRGRNESEDRRLRDELLTSEKDRAENTMIVDLLRNDLGRVCEFGSIEVEKLCELADHPTLFHLVSTIRGTLRTETKPSDIIRALFPCGSITGAPKISTMRIIDEMEQTPRGLSMGAIGYYVPPETFGLPETLDLSVAIRTMTIRDKVATFSVGGGITIDSDPEKEYEETLVKAKALLNAIGTKAEPPA